MDEMIHTFLLDEMSLDEKDLDHMKWILDSQTKEASSDEMAPKGWKSQVLTNSIKLGLEFG